MASRTVAQEDYRFGFNGKENDGETGTQDYGMRVYNPVLGRFFSVDPLEIDYPWYTPYQFSGNMPIACIDLDGLEPRGGIAPTIQPSPQRPQRSTPPPGPGRTTPSHPAPIRAPLPPDPVRINYSPAGFPYLETPSASEYLSYPPPGNIVPPGTSLPRWDQNKREQRARDFAMEQAKKTPGPKAELYELRAKRDGWYKCYACDGIIEDGNIYRTSALDGSKEIYLKQGELWKIGKTNQNDKPRYNKNDYEYINFDYEVVAEGTEAEILILEKSAIVAYPFHPENRERSRQSLGNDSIVNTIPRPAGCHRDK